MGERVDLLARGANATGLKLFGASLTAKDRLSEVVGESPLADSLGAREQKTACKSPATEGRFELFKNGVVTDQAHRLSLPGTDDLGWVMMDLAASQILWWI